DRVLEATLGAPGIAATRVLFVMDGKAYVIDQDGAERRLVSSTDHAAMSPAWAADGRRFSYMEFWQGHGRLFVQDVASGKRARGAAADLRDGGGRDGPAAVRAVRLRGYGVVQRPRVVTRRAGRRLPPRRRGHVTGVCARRAHARGAAAHFSRAERGSNLGPRQPPYGVRVG